jgi:ribose transport system permease protein
MMINALVTLRIEFFWQSVASGVVIVSSVALYTWMQKKDRDGAHGLMAALRSKEARKLMRFSAALIGALILLLALGAGLATEPAPSG